jgi:cardiolipin synthase
MMSMLPPLGEAYYVLEWIIRLAMLAVVPFRRSPAATTSWLLLVFFLPLAGLLLFLAIGAPRFPRWRTARFKQLLPFFEQVAERIAQAAPPAADTPSDIANLALRLGKLPASGGNALELLEDYELVIDRLIADIDGARCHVRILAYIFADDLTGNRVIAALQRATQRGVACHVLFDPVGSNKWRKGLQRRLQEAGVTVRAALPFRLLGARTRRDMRNHRKLFLIDGEIGYAGSQNLVSRDFRPGVINRELVARVTGPAVTAMNAVFLGDWYLETEDLIEPDPTPAPIDAEPADAATLQVLPSGADYPTESFQALLTWQVDVARSEVVIVTPYLIPDESLLAALRTAVMRGVDVRIIASSVVDQWLVRLAQDSYYDELLRSGVRIHTYRDELLHAKNVRIDGRLGILGSSNVDIRSFQLNEEVSLLLLDPQSIAALEQIQRRYIAQSDEISRAEWRHRDRIRKLAENGARLVSPLL